MRREAKERRGGRPQGLLERGAQRESEGRRREADASGSQRRKASSSGRSEKAKEAEESEERSLRM